MLLTALIALMAAVNLPLFALLIIELHKQKRECMLAA